MLPGLFDYSHPCQAPHRCLCSQFPIPYPHCLVAPDADSKDTKKLFLFTHIHFDIAYNEDRIIEINVSQGCRAKECWYCMGEGMGRWS